MKIAIAGGTGFVGEALKNHLLSQGHDIYILTRTLSNKQSNSKLQYVEWLTPSGKPEEHLNGIDAFINLAGESLNSGRWTEQRKKRIIESRITATQEVIRIIKSLPEKPEVLLNASAIGIYGTSLEEHYTEDSQHIGTDFLASTVAAWENEAKKAEQLGVRTCYLRLGVVLGKDGGALNRMILPYHLFIGGTIGSGQQWLSWIHIKDVVTSIDFLLHNQNITGAVNLTSPSPMRMKNFGKEIGNALHRPHWLPVPGFALNLLLGEMSILVLEGQHVYPKKLLDHGFQFSYYTVKAALDNIL